MAAQRACGLVTVTVNSVDISEAVSEVTIDFEVGTSESANFADCAVDRAPTFSKCTISGTFYYNGPSAGDVAAEVEAALGGVTTPTVTVALSDGAASPTTVTYGITAAAATDYELDSSVEDWLSGNFTFVSTDGVITRV